MPRPTANLNLNPNPAMNSFIFKSLPRIDMAEADDQVSDSSELETNPFNVSEDLVPSRTPKAAGILTLAFDGLLDPPLRLHEDLKDGNGGQAWPAGMVLAKYLLKHRRREMEGKSMFVRFLTTNCTAVILIMFGFIELNSVLEAA